VDALGQLSGADPARLLALWELADRAARPGDAARAAQADQAASAAEAGRAAGDARADKPDQHRLQPPPGHDTDPPRNAPPALEAAWSRWWGPRTLAAATVGIALLVILGVLVWPTSGRAGSESGAEVALLPGGYSCDFSTRGGRWYAGHSSTSDRLVGLNVGGQDVVEVQCLLKHHGLDPGRIDGMFGRHTEKAVEQLQSAGATTVDGVVGPQPWVLLRR
jgi:hypothetical protein